MTWTRGLAALALLITAGVLAGLAVSVALDR